MFAVIRRKGVSHCICLAPCPLQQDYRPLSGNAGRQQYKARPQTAQQYGLSHILSSTSAPPSKSRCVAWNSLPTPANNALFMLPNCPPYVYYHIPTCIPVAAVTVACCFNSK